MSAYKKEYHELTAASLAADPWLTAICHFYDLGVPLRVASLSLPWRLHEVMTLQTTQRRYFLKKYAFLEKKQLKNIYTALQKSLAKKFSFIFPIKNSVKDFFEDEKYLWLVFPYQPGNVIVPPAVSLSQIKIMAQCLAEIHVWPFEDALISAERVEITDKDLLDVAAVGLSIEDLRYYQKQFQENRALLKQKSVMGHADLRPDNVIWRKNKKPVIIDWDQYGAVNREVDVFNSAINWAGIETETFSLTHYHAFIEAYLLAAGKTIVINETVIAASFGSWLAWLVFLAKQAQRYPINSLEKQACIDQMRVSERALGCLIAHREKLNCGR